MPKANEQYTQVYGIGELPLHLRQVVCSFALESRAPGITRGIR